MSPHCDLRRTGGRRSRDILKEGPPGRQVQAGDAAAKRQEGVYTLLVVHLGHWGNIVLFEERHGSLKCAKRDVVKNPVAAAGAIPA